MGRVEVEVERVEKRRARVLLLLLLLLLFLLRLPLLPTEDGGERLLVWSICLGRRCLENRKNVKKTKKRRKKTFSTLFSFSLHL